jgi:hypothetical protein
MKRFMSPACLAIAFGVGIAGGTKQTWAQPASSQQEKYSGGTQGLQEKLYEERLRELQVNQSAGRSQQVEGVEASGTSRSQSGRGSSMQAPSQAGSEGRSGDPGRQTDQPARK